MWPLRLYTIQTKPKIVECIGLNQPKMKIRVNVFISSVSAERFWEIGRPLPLGRIATNLNLLGVKNPREELLEVPFVFTASYNPAVAQISVKGKAHVSGEKQELKKVYAAYKEKKALPPMILQAISNVVLLESLLISRTLNVPPPIPLPKVPLMGAEKKKAEPSYRA
ncbi:MAG: hypothetical protein ACE5KD_01305 [Candidatus Bathyarchaeia archaeon]